VQAALDSLPLDFRVAVVLCDIEGLSYEEIAATLGIKLGTVRSRIHRGRLALRESLAHRAPARSRYGAGITEESFAEDSLTGVPTADEAS
jgi:RNA polymerase sigma-70 factor (ECF subfamily)